MFQSIYHLKLREFQAGRKQLRGFQTSATWSVGRPGRGQMLPLQLEPPSEGERWTRQRRRATHLKPSQSPWPPSHQQQDRSLQRAVPPSLPAVP